MLQSLALIAEFLTPTPRKLMVAEIYISNMMVAQTYVEPDFKNTCADK